MTKRTRIRQALKEAVSQLLNAGSSSKPATVFANRPFSVDEQDLPVAFCYMLEGASSEYALDDAYDSTQLMVSLYVMESNQADAELDVLAEVLAGLNESNLSGLLTEGMGLINWAYGQDEEGTGLASLTLSFNATWSDSDV